MYGLGRNLAVVSKDGEIMVGYCILQHKTESFCNFKRGRYTGEESNFPTKDDKILQNSAIKPTKCGIEDNAEVWKNLPKRHIQLYNESWIMTMHVSFIHITTKVVHHFQNAVGCLGIMSLMYKISNIHI